MSRRLVAVTLGPTLLAVIIAGCHGPPPSSPVESEDGGELISDEGDGGPPRSSGADGGSDGGDPQRPDAGQREYDIRELQAYLAPRNSVVRVEGVVVTGVRHATNYSHLFVQEPHGAPEFSGLHVLVPDALAAVTGVPRVGDVVNLRGRIGEYANPNYWGSHTALTDVENLEIVGPGEVPAAVSVHEAELVGRGTDNPWHSVLVRVENVHVVAINEREELVLLHELLVDDALYDFELPSVGTEFTSITGPLHHAYGTNRILPRGAGDFAAPE